MAGVALQASPLTSHKITLTPALIMLPTGKKKRKSSHAKKTDHATGNGNAGDRDAPPAVDRLSIAIQAHVKLDPSDPSASPVSVTVSKPKPLPHTNSISADRDEEHKNENAPKTGVDSNPGSKVAAAWDSPAIAAAMPPPSSNPYVKAAVAARKSKHRSGDQALLLLPPEIVPERIRQCLLSRSRSRKAASSPSSTKSSPTTPAAASRPRSTPTAATVTPAPRSSVCKQHKNLSALAELQANDRESGSSTSSNDTLLAPQFFRRANSSPRNNKTLNKTKTKKQFWEWEDRSSSDGGDRVRAVAKPRSMPRIPSRRKHASAAPARHAEVDDHQDPYYYHSIPRRRMTYRSMIQPLHSKIQEVASRMYGGELRASDRARHQRDRRRLNP
ncbi:protein rpi-1-like [Selaginella moellendorffii]|uniref:protein rpi-1-like n=1 Tax=Selaginella moellendorffii TaxID=88036 RepID=UPI000D1C80BA|nr:protein rpi-1-like [Selaginella moellendorffii]|eukprot:XP_024514886.1 protein rpi-1-like [Selaginella moellendorffii]